MGVGPSHAPPHGTVRSLRLRPWLRLKAVPRAAHPRALNPPWLRPLRMLLDLGSTGPSFLPLETLPKSAQPQRRPLLQALRGMRSEGDRQEGRRPHLESSPLCTSHGWRLLFPRVSDKSLPSRSASLCAPAPSLQPPRFSYTALLTIRHQTCVSLFTSCLSRYAVRAGTWSV